MGARMTTTCLLLHVALLAVDMGHCRALAGSWIRSSHRRPPQPSAPDAPLQPSSPQQPTHEPYVRGRVFVVKGSVISTRRKELEEIRRVMPFTVGSRKSVHSVTLRERDDSTSATELTETFCHHHRLPPNMCARIELEVQAVVSGEGALRQQPSVLGSCWWLVCVAAGCRWVRCLWASLVDPARRRICEKGSDPRLLPKQAVVPCRVVCA